MPIEMRWLGTACFEIVLPNKKRLIIDPYVDDAVSAPIKWESFEGCDYIFITHGHYDHVLDVGKLASRFSPKIFCSSVTADSLMKFQGVAPELFTWIKAGDIVREDGLRVEVVPGVHVDFAREYKRLSGRDLNDGFTEPMEIVKKCLRVMLDSDRIPHKFQEWMSQYPPGEQLNFVFEPAGGKRIYMAGSYPDPDIIDAARGAKAHMTLLQVLPGNCLRGLEEQTAQLAMASGCKIVVPQHHDLLIEGAMETELTELKRILTERSDIVFKEFVPGEWYRFDW